MKLSLFKCCFLGSLLCHVLGFVAIHQWTRATAVQSPVVAVEPSAVTLLILPADEFSDAGPTRPTRTRAASTLAAAGTTEPPAGELYESGDFINFLKSSALPDTQAFKMAGRNIAPQTQVETVATEPAPSSAAPSPDANALRVRVSSPLVVVRERATSDPNYSRNPRPDYPLAARRRQEQGIVRLRVQLSAQGSVVKIEIKQSSGFRALDDAAVRAVRAWEFSPARIGAQAITSEVEVPVEFKLN